MNTVLRHALPFAVAFLAGSPQGAVGQSGATVRDSAGTRIVQGSRQALRTRTTWRVDPASSVSIGVLDGPDPYVLVNPLAATVLDGGTIVIAQNLASFSEIRFFDGRGVFQATAGRKGSGPGEFSTLSTLIPLSGDSVMALDADNIRFAIFGARGELLADGRVNGIHRFYDAQNLDRNHAGFRVPGPPSGRMPEGLQRELDAYVVYSWMEEAVDTIAEAPGLAAYYERIGKGVLYHDVPFAPLTYGAAGAGRFWVGEAGTGVIRGYRADGSVATIIRDVHARMEVTRAEERRYREHALSLRPPDPETRGRREAYYASVRFPKEMPAFLGMKVDRAGNLWVLRYTPPWWEGDELWDVFDRDGNPLAVATIPAAIVPVCAKRFLAMPCHFIREIGAGYLLLWSRGELDAERITKHAVSKGESRAADPVARRAKV